MHDKKKNIDIYRSYFSLDLYVCYNTCHDANYVSQSSPIPLVCEPIYGQISIDIEQSTATLKNYNQIKLTNTGLFYYNLLFFPL